MDTYDTARITEQLKGEKIMLTLSDAEKTFTTFQNDSFGHISAFLIKNTPWFIAKEIAAVGRTPHDLDKYSGKKNVQLRSAKHRTPCATQMDSQALAGSLMI